MPTSNVYLEHALLDVHDLEASLTFYKRLFPDWVVRWQGRTRDGAPWAHFGPAGERQPGYLSLPERSAAGAGVSGTLRIEHVGFAHPDVAVLEKRLAEAGIRPSDRIEAEGYRRVYFVDPSGHELEFVQRLEI